MFWPHHGTGAKDLRSHLHHGSFLVLDLRVVVNTPGHIRLQKLFGILVHRFLHGFPFYEMVITLLT